MKLVLLFLFTFAFAQAQMTARAIIHSLDRTILSSQIAGNIVYLAYEVSESFKKGKLLAKINCSIYEAQKKKIMIQKNIAKVKLQKNEALDALNSIGKFEVLISREEYNKQVAELTIVSVNVKRCRIYAPFNGKIVQKKINLYENVKAQKEILEIIGTRIEAKIIVPATWLRWLKKGAPLMLSIDETQTKVKAKIIAIGATVDPSSQTVSLRAKIIKPYGAIISGMSATAIF